MRYLTKEWYERMQQMDLHLLLKEDSRCFELSEDLYKELYDKEKNNFLKGKIIDIDVFGEDYFNSLIENRVERYKNKLPKDILKDVCDVRVLGLGYATSNVIEEIKEFSLNNERYVKEMIAKVNSIEEKEFGGKNVFVNNVFHDSEIKSIRVKDNDLVVNLKPCFTNKKKINFKEFVILLDEDLNNCWWLYEEIYRCNEGVEVHILGDSENGLKELILRCSEVIIE